MVYDYCTEVTPQCPVSGTIYAYEPNLAANAFLAAWFAALFVPNIIFGVYYKAWSYMVALGLGCVCECLGYIGRVMLHNNPWSTIGFEIQICCLILGPAFNTAAIYLTLKHIALTFGPEHSIIKPRFYTYIFITGDLLSLVLQGIGGGTAATAADGDVARTNLGTNIMIAGIVWQVITLGIFAAAAGTYVYKRRKAMKVGHTLSEEAVATKSDRRFKLFVWAVISAFVAVFFRCVYRIAELAPGWGNKIMRDEVSYMILEGAFIAYATFVQTAFHPGYCFPQLTGRWQKKNKQEKVETQQQSQWS